MTDTLHGALVACRDYCKSLSDSAYQTWLKSGAKEEGEDWENLKRADGDFVEADGMLKGYERKMKTGDDNDFS